MAHLPSNWLLNPVIPAAPALPRLDADSFQCAYATETLPTEEPVEGPYPSGTWTVGSHAEESDSVRAQREATSDSEAPTVRPGLLYAMRTG